MCLARNSNAYVAYSITIWYLGKLMFSWYMGSMEIVWMCQLYQAVRVLSEGFLVGTECRNVGLIGIAAPPT